MMAERGVGVDYSTLYRWVQRYAPELEKGVRWYQGYRSTRGFQSMKTAYATIKHVEIMRMIRRGHCILIEPGVRFVNKLFDFAA